MYLRNVADIPQNWCTLPKISPKYRCPLVPNGNSSCRLLTRLLQDVCGGVYEQPPRGGCQRHHVFVLAARLSLRVEQLCRVRRNQFDSIYRSASKSRKETHDLARSCGADRTNENMFASTRTLWVVYMYISRLAEICVLIHSKNVNSVDSS